MKRTLLYILSLVLLIASCSQEQETAKNNTSNKTKPLPEEKAKAQHMTALEFSKVIATKEGCLLDVRTPHEYANGHLREAGVLNYYSRGFKKRILLIDKEQNIFIYCATGNRSYSAANFLIKNGYKNVYNLKRGIVDWNRNRLPTIKEANAVADTKDLVQADELKTIIQANEFVLVDFYAPWCAPCQKMMPMIDSLSTEYAGKIAITKINIDASKKLMKVLKISTVPYLALYQNGQKIFDHKGWISRTELTNILNKHSLKQ